MYNLRAENFPEIESIYADLKTFIQQCKRLEHKIIASGLQKIAKTISRIVSYQASNRDYWNYISSAATAINCLINLHEWRLCNAVKDMLSNLFNRLAAILPADFQLNLFEASEEFGWNRMPEEKSTVTKTNNPWFSFIKKLATVEVPQWLVQLLKRNWVSPFQGQQLTFANAAFV